MNYLYKKQNGFEALLGEISKVVHKVLNVETKMEFYFLILTFAFLLWEFQLLSKLTEG